jgi:hypothetical protein
LADWHYAPTDQAFANLVAEGVRPERIRVTGNTIVSALARYTEAKYVKNPKKQILITLHRREIQSHLKTEELATAIGQAAWAAHEHLFVWPQHPAFRKILPKLGPMPKNVLITEPMAYEVFAKTLSESKGVITDSGGLVEEAATLGDEKWGDAGDVAVGDEGNPPQSDVGLRVCGCGGSRRAAFSVCGVTEVSSEKRRGARCASDHGCYPSRLLSSSPSRPVL